MKASIMADIALLIFGAAILAFGVMLAVSEYVAGVLFSIAGGALALAAANDIRVLVRR